MSIYINPGNGYYTTAAGRNFFIDKSEMILELNEVFGADGQGRVCVSRPRRFGKTMAANMIAAYYDCSCDSRALFEGLKVAQTPGWDKWLNKCNVVKVDIAGFFGPSKSSDDIVTRISDTVVKEMIAAFPNADITTDMMLDEAIMTAYNSDGRPFVVIFDEYDAFIRYNVTGKEFTDYLGLLNNLFKIDSMSEVIQLAYITGILPIVRDKFESKLNNFTQLTMLRPGRWGKYIGFTRDEVRSVCDKAGMDYQVCLDWYDGYKIDKETDIASPYSVTEAAKSGSFSSHWTHVGAFESLASKICMNMHGIKDDVVKLISGVPIKVDVESYQNNLNFKNKGDIITYLIHLGYLTYNTSTEEITIPNHEVMMEWKRTMADTEEYAPVIELAESSRRVLTATIGRDAKTVADILNRAHRVLTSSLSYNNEQSLQSAIILAYYAARKEYNVFTELPAGDGFADVAFIPVVPSPERPAMIVELKWNKDTGVALDQIREKRYADALSNYKGNIICAAITYNTRTKKHVCEFEEKVV